MFRLLIASQKVYVLITVISNFHKIEYSIGPLNVDNSEYNDNEIPDDHIEYLSIDLVS